MKNKIWILAILVVFFLYPNTSNAAEKIKIVTTSSVIADLTHEIVGDEASIYCVASPKRDIHFIEPTPVDVMKLKKADVFIHTGLDIEAWRPPLVDAAGNEKFLGESVGAIDVSRGVSLLEVPTSISRVLGDIHLFGNPHYWVNPENSKVMVHNIVNGLSKLYPEKGPLFSEREKGFNQKIDEAIKRWDEKLKPYKGTAVITYHKSWPYFLERFGFVSLGELEPKPGIPPTAKHLAEIINIMKEKGGKIIIKESFQESRTPEKIAKQTGAKVATLFQEVHEGKGADDYLSMMDHNVNALEEALK